MKFKNPYWDAKTKIELLSKWIIVHSILYYELDSPLVSDQEFDKNARQLVEMVNQNKEEFKSSKWYYVLKDFDATTGFHIYGKLKKSDQGKLYCFAKYLIEINEKRKTYETT